MKKIFLTIMIATTLVTSQANAYLFGVAVNPHKTYSEKISHYNDMDAFVSFGLVIAVLAIKSAAVAHTVALVFLLDVNATDGSSEQALIKAIPELANKPEVTQELIKLAQNGKSETLETEKGQVEARYIESETLNSFLAQTDLSADSIKKLTLIFSKNSSSTETP